MSIKLSHSNGWFRGGLVQVGAGLREAGKTAPVKIEPERKDTYPRESKLRKLADQFRPSPQTPRKTAMSRAQVGSKL